jgi:hypothetical protein
MRKDSKKVETTDDLAGFSELNQEDQDELSARILSFWDTTVTITKPPPKKRVKKEAAAEEGGEESSPVKKAKKPPAASAEKKPKSN